MTKDFEITPLTVAEAERRARELRAEAAREGFANLLRLLRRAFAAPVAGRDKSAHA